MDFPLAEPMTYAVRPADHVRIYILIFDFYFDRDHCDI